MRRQTQALRRQIQHEATLEERQRIAREFHDTLEQGLTGWRCGWMP
ncbi:histidine kinase [Verrucomicrobium spinosum]|nr:histidine kinase [Verrucomicrobium spinosum]